MKDTTRVLLLGAPCIGKTHFVCKLALAQQFYQYLPTPGVDVHGYYVDDTFIKIYDSFNLIFNHHNKKIKLF